MYCLHVHMYICRPCGKHKWTCESCSMVKSMSMCIQFADVANPLGDERFVAMFSNPNFQIDEESEVLHITSLLTTPSKKNIQSTWKLSNNYVKNFIPQLWNLRTKGRDQEDK